MSLKLEAVDERGDWVEGVRLPEYRVNWVDGQHQRHPLEVVGRQLYCVTHHRSALSAALEGLPKLGSAKPRDCDELREHWPKLFEPGDEFLDFHVRALPLQDRYRAPQRKVGANRIRCCGSVELEGTALNQVRLGVLATMFDALVMAGRARGIGYGTGFSQACRYFGMNATDWKYRDYVLKRVRQRAVAMESWLTEVAVESDGLGVI